MLVGCGVNVGVRTVLLAVRNFEIGAGLGHYSDGLECGVGVSAIECRRFKPV